MHKADEYFLSPIYNQAFNTLKKIVNKDNVLNKHRTHILYIYATDSNGKISPVDN